MLTDYEKGVKIARANMLGGEKVGMKNCSYDEAMEYLDHDNDEFIRGYVTECRRICTD